MINALLTVAIVALVTFQRDRVHFIAGAIVALGLLLLEATRGFFENSLNYLVAAACYLFIIKALTGLRPVIETTILLQRACIAAMVFNAVAAALWFVNHDPIIYGAALNVTKLFITAVLVRTLKHAREYRFIADRRAFDRPDSSRHKRI